MPTWKLWIPGLLTVFLLACGGGNDGGGQPQTYTVGGSIQGLTVNRLSLANGSNLISPAANATSFVFPTQLTSGASYSVAVQTQPLGLTCTVSSGTGNVGSTNVTNIAVTCVPAVPAETNLHYFGTGTDGANPAAGLIQGSDGNFYGTAYEGGESGDGAVFKITLAGAETVLYSFTGKIGDGANPQAALIQGTDGNFYGTTKNGGTIGVGTVFKITPAGVETVLYSFTGKNGDGANPQAALIQGGDGNFYGTTYYGGTTGTSANGSGTVFKITPSGTLTTLYSFCSQTNCTDGEYPDAGLILATDGDFYGTTYGGGAASSGTIFKITPSGTLTTLYRFCSQTNCTDGSEPHAGLIQATDGDFYGTTWNGGVNLDGGTVFKITPSGTLTTLYSFCSQTNCADGAYPEAGLIQATNGDLYGTTNEGGYGMVLLGFYGYGTVFKITPGGTLTTLYSFCPQTGCTDGELPLAGLIQATNGNFYGTTNEGGANNDGVVFGLSVGLGPFVETQTGSGKVGTAVKILGTDLTGATSVIFNGTAATFTVVSMSEITTTVPTGATTGPVEVTTPSGTLTSNVNFTVEP
jgi:uncharacterized repeat protein (TIGR03803 family)